MASQTVIMTLTLLLFMSLPLTPSGQHVGTTLVEGDIYVHVMAAVYTEINATGSCTSIEAETVQQLEAIKWIFQRLNSDNYIPDVRIGVRVSETCGSIDRAKKAALDLSAELAGNGTNLRTVGVIGHDYSSESEAISALFSSLPHQFRLLQISYSATALSLRDRQKYPNFFRVIPSDDLQVQTLKSFIQAMNYTYMALIYSDDAYGRGLKELLHSSIGSVEVCIPVNISLSSNDTDVEYLQEFFKTQLTDVSPPISGALVFVPYIMTERILNALRNITVSANIPPPVFLMSEANAYISESYKDVIKGSFVLSPRRKIIQQFEWIDRLVNFPRLYEEVKSNKWLRDMYKDGLGCELADTLVNNMCAIKDSKEIEASFPESAYTQYTIQAALTMAKAIKDTYQQTCRTGGLCNEFLSLPRSEFIDTANGITVEYDNDFGAFEIDAFKNPDLETAFSDSPEVIVKTNLPLYEVYTYQTCNTSLCKVKIADLSNVREFSLQKDALQDYFDPEARKAQCPDGYQCSTCGDALADQSILYIPGDLYIVGIVPIHEKGATTLQCGAFKSGGIDISEAIRFAVQEETLDASVGVIIIDSCSDPQIIQENILTLHRLGIFKDGSYMPVADQIIGYIGGWTSDVSKAVAEITSGLGIPQISYASTATSLSRRSLYKYFLRIPSPDNEQARVMIDLVKTQIKTNFVQILYSQSEYGEGGRDILIKRAAEVNICVAQSIGIRDTTDVNTIVPNLRRQRDAKVVLVFLSSSDVRNILETLNNDTEKGEFIFIASEEWGRRYNVGSYNKLFGSISLTSELDINDKFTDTISELSIQSANDNFWVRPYIEWYFSCYSQWNFNKTSNMSCSDSLSLDTSSYQIEVWSAFTERAVTALLNGARQAMTKYCGNSRAICDNLRNNTDGFVAEIKAQTHLENGNNIRIFDDNGDGRAGYRIYVASNKQGEQYFPIGQINPDSAIFFETNKYLDRGGQVLDYTCSGQPKCLECFPVEQTSEESSSLSVPLIIVVVFLGLICCILGGILLFLCIRYGCCLKIENGRVRIVDYRTPVYFQKEHRPNSDSEYNYISDGAFNVGPALPARGQNFPRAGNDSFSNETSAGSAGSRSGNSGSNGSRAGVDVQPRTAVRYTHQNSSQDSGVDTTDIDVSNGMTAPRDGQHQFNRPVSNNDGYLRPIALQDS